MKLNSIVTYKDLSLKLAGYCGLIEDVVPGKPDVVWVRWMGETIRKKEDVNDLEEI